MKINSSCFYLLLLSICFIGSCRNEPGTSSPAPGTSINNTVTVRLRAKPQSMNPYLTVSRYSRQVYNNIFQQLLDFDPVTLQLAPVLAVARPVKEEITAGEFAGGVAYTYEIRPEARWNNGSPVLASDVIFTLKAIFNPKVQFSAYRGAFSFIGDVVADPVNERKFTFFTKDKYFEGEFGTAVLVLPEYNYDPKGLLRNVPLKDLLDENKAGELAESLPALQEFANEYEQEKYGREAEYISGSGPYQLEEWITGERLVLRKKDDWWGDKLTGQLSPLLEAKPKSLVYLPIEDVNAVENLIKNNSIDVAGNLQPRNFKELEEDPAVKMNYNFFSVPARDYAYYTLNTRNPKLSDRRVRRALAHLLDMDQAIEDFFYGYTDRVIGPVLQSDPYFNKNLKPIPFDVAKARSLLKEAGWTDSNNNGIVDKIIDGQRVEMDLNLSLSNSSVVGQDISLMWQESARKAGVNINLNAKEFNAVIQERNTLEFEILLLASGRPMGNYDPKQSWHTESDRPGGGNHSGYGNAASDAIIDQLRTTIDEDQARPLYLKFQEDLYEEQPSIFLYALPNLMVISKRIKDPLVSAARPNHFENTFVVTK